MAFFRQPLVCRLDLTEQRENAAMHYNKEEEVDELKSRLVWVSFQGPDLDLCKMGLTVTQGGKTHLEGRSASLHMPAQLCSDV